MAGPTGCAGQSHHVVGLNKALTFTSLEKGNEEIEELRFLFCPEQSGHADSASDNISSSQESDGKLSSK